MSQIPPSMRAVGEAIAARTRRPELHDTLTGYAKGQPLETMIAEDFTPARPTTVVSRLEAINHDLATADELMGSTRTALWGGYPEPTVGDLGMDGLLSQLLDVIEQRVSAVMAHAHAFHSELNG